MADNQDPNQQGNAGGAAQTNNQSAQQQQAQQPSVYQDLATKKGYKTPDDMAKSYTEAEAELGKRQGVLDTTKQQLEAQGFTLDDKGNIVQGQQQAGQYQEPYQQPAGTGQQQPYGQQPYQQPAETIYDPYTGQALTNPIDIQLAKLPPSQRTGIVVNAIIDQREKWQGSAYANETELLTKPEAKGFEDDVKKVMMQVPLQYRANKESWSDALLKVKGAKYDEMKAQAGGEGVDNFLNKSQNQPIPQAGAANAQGGARLTAEQETDFKRYETQSPGLFKDRQDYLNHTMNTGAR